MLVAGKALSVAYKLQHVHITSVIVLEPACGFGMQLQLGASPRHQDLRNVFLDGINILGLRNVTMDHELTDGAFVCGDPGDMSQLRLPGFTAEASLYRINIRYYFNTRELIHPDESSKVYPQSCPWWEWALCGVKISGCTTLCTTSSGIAWWACMTGCLWITGAAQCLRCLQG
jgi:hypothetical protein